MDFNYYYGHIQKLHKLRDDEARARISWFQQLSLLCSAVLGLLAALPSTRADSLFPRTSFVLMMVSLAIGTVLSAICLYGYQVLLAKLRRKNYEDEIEQAVRENREVGNAFFVVPKRYELCEKTCYIVLLMTVFFLLSYVVMIVGC